MITPPRATNLVSILVTMNKSFIIPVAGASRMGVDIIGVSCGTKSRLGVMFTSVNVVECQLNPSWHTKIRRCRCRLATGVRVH
mmetsp:Transcript_47836/g.96349  ORF Transcript_47836/g.96349 Transcript_47836/m.96349 type:complete len:83 (-) Transcript_47836:176-424(-)